MHEDRWLACDDPTEMLRHFPGKPSPRKLRLFNCACCRRIWDRLPDEACRQAVEISERFADGMASLTELNAAEAAARVSLVEDPAQAARTAAVLAAGAGVWVCSVAASVVCVQDGIPLPEDARVFPRLGTLTRERRHAMEELRRLIVQSLENALQAGLLRCLFGNPFHVDTFDLSWQTPAVVALALAAYQERILPAGELDPDRLAILADALEEAGCTRTDMLEHCREPGPHTRGCHVVDWILGRE